MTFAVLTRVRHSVGLHGRYLAEICRSEGLADQLTIDLDDLPVDALAEVLRRSHTLLISACSMARAEIELVLAHLERGGTVIAVRPSRPLARALGLRTLDRHTPAAYVRPDTSEPVVRGLTAEPVQALVPLDLYEPVADARTIAWGDSTASSFSPDEPAVFTFRKGNGTVVVFGYDVAAAIARLRHGDSSLVGTRSQGGLPYRCTDLMLDQIDRSTWHLPQADVHAQLLTNCLVAYAPAPVPRWWYYPDAEMRTVVVQDSDDDWSTAEQFEAMVEAADRHDFRTTFYLMMGNNPTLLAEDRIRELAAAGHTFGIHHDGLEGWDDGDDQNLLLEEVIRGDIERFRRQFGHPPVANRNHALVWFGSDELPLLYAELGIVMEFNTQAPIDCWLNFIAGSSRPLRHVTGTGEVLDVYQQPTQVFDDAQLIDRLGNDALREAAAVRGHLEGLLERGHGPLAMQSHPVSFVTYSRQFFELVWTAARELGVEIWSATQWAGYVQARDASTLSTTWTDQGGQIKASARGTTGRQTLLVPVGPEVRVGEAGVERIVVVHGLEYRAVSLAASADGVDHTIDWVPRPAAAGSGAA